ncbi:MAG TPA: hypothetical protein VJP89_08935 [Pyrinomonadaceae bacterium]|nr:hypothetical protein [Pyrinomonadaceae bacterium]
MQYWQNLDRYAWLYLLTCLALVLGSWIGYRRSLNRSAYEVKFFNLPFFRFLLDQAMLILYFQVVGSTVVDLTKSWTDPSANSNLSGNSKHLADSTIALLTLIFVLYWLWDILGMCMAISKKEVHFKEVDSAGQQHDRIITKPRYPDPKDNSKDNKICDDMKQATPDTKGFAITSVSLVVLGLVWFSNRCFYSFSADSAFIISIIVLVLYRLAKEVRSTCLQS